MDGYRVSTQVFLWLLGIWSVVGLSNPDIIPAAITAGIGVALAGLVVLSHFRKIRFLPFPIALVTLAFASPLWTGTESSFRPALFYAAVTFCALVLASYVPVGDAIRMFDLGFKVVAVTTILMVVFARSAAFDDRPPNVDTLTGPYVHKNLLGTILVLGLLTAIYARWPKPARGRVVIWVAVYLGLIAMTRSTTAYVLAAMVLAVALVTRNWSSKTASQRATSVTLTAVALVVLVPALWLALDTLLEFLGRDATLSGRSRIWTMTVEAWRLRPWLGYGWGTAYEETSVAANLIRDLTGWYVPSSHSGYLSVLLQLGAVGAILLVLFTASVLTQSVLQLVADGSPAWRWVLLAVLVFAINNVFDSRLDTSAWLLMVASAVWLKDVRRLSAKRTGLGRSQQRV